MPAWHSWTPEFKFQYCKEKAPCNQFWNFWYLNPVLAAIIWLGNFKVELSQD
jgi:hypothetical protein